MLRDTDVHTVNILNTVDKEYGNASLMIQTLDTSSLTLRTERIAGSKNKSLTTTLTCQNLPMLPFLSLYLIHKMPKTMP